MGRGSGNQITKGDYLLIDIPPDSTAEWLQTKKNEYPDCEMFNDGEALKCEILGARTAKITLAAQRNQILHGTIGNFLNPHSIKKIAGMSCSLFTRRDVPKIVSTGLEIDTFTPSIIDAKLSSTSAVVGATSQTLKISLDPRTKITWKGIITLRTPEYYKDARDYMFGDSDVRPCTSDKGTVKECRF